GEVEQHQADAARLQQGHDLPAVVAGDDIVESGQALQREGEGPEPGGLVVHQKDLEAGIGALGHDAGSSLATGRLRVTVVPRPGVESKAMLPPCSLTMPAETDRPRPVPPLSLLVVKKGSVNRARCSGAMPVP